MSGDSYIDNVLNHSNLCDIMKFDNENKFTFEIYLLL